MVAVLGGLVVFLAFVVAGMWATIRVQREQSVHDLVRTKKLESYVMFLEAHARRTVQDEDIPPRAVQFVVVPAEGSADGDDERATDVSEFLAFDLASMGDDRPTLT